MANVNYDDCPVAVMDEFEMVIIDVTYWDDEYTANFNMFKQFADDGGNNGQGMSLLTYMSGDTLYDLYLKIDTLVSMGFFNGTEVCSHGTLYDENHEEIDTICWNSFADEYDDEDDEDITHQLTHTAPHTLH